jgi:hypothetical protein
MYELFMNPDMFLSEDGSYQRLLCESLGSQPKGYNQANPYRETAVSADS